jgi:hypothetical protein
MTSPLAVFARLEGIPLRTGIELSLMTRYFLFQVIHGFLIVTLASGLVKAIPAIAQNPGSAVTLLATQLPAASTFFLTYFVRPFSLFSPLCRSEAHTSSLAGHHLPRRCRRFSPSNRQARCLLRQAHPPRFHSPFGLQH